MKYNKIFVIGFGKTGTTTLHELFLELGLKSTHRKVWELDKFQCFSDSNTRCHLNNEYDFTKLDTLYPNSLFILNTRKLNDWLTSFANHRLIKTKYKEGFHWVPYLEFFCKYLILREQHHANILNFFKKDPEKLLIVNIDNANWVSFVAQHIGHTYDKNLRRNVSNKKKITSEERDLVNKLLLETYDHLDVADIHSTDVDPELAKLYKNNL